LYHNDHASEPTLPLPNDNIEKKPVQHLLFNGRKDNQPSSIVVYNTRIELHLEGKKNNRKSRPKFHCPELFFSCSYDRISSLPSNVPMKNSRASPANWYKCATNEENDIEGTSFCLFGCQKLKMRKGETRHYLIGPTSPSYARSNT
jgi:hypothetical protein